MDCSCVFIEEYTESEFSDSKITKARKTHKCVECGETIKKGDRYEYTSGLWDGDFSVYKTCMNCLSIRDSFFCKGWGYGAMLEDLYEHLLCETDVSNKCMAGLTKPARDRVCDMIEQIWDGQD